jgi:hypothetical protein
MRPEEVAAVGDLAAEAVGGVVGRVQDVHAGIARRAFWALGAGATPVRLVHDGITGISYKAVRGIGAAALRSGALAASAMWPSDAASIDNRQLGRRAVGALNGAFGDALERRGSPLAVRMTLRRSGQAVAPVADTLAPAFPDATPRLAVFLHGQGETEDAWSRAADRAPPYGLRLRAELGYTPLFVRYNTGRPISENGRELGWLLEQVQREWPTEVAEIALIGHAMGGLVARSACYDGAGSLWARRVRHVFALGSPHHGSLYGAAPEATGRELPFLRSANHYFVSASLTRGADAPLGRLVGDLFVRRSSAWAQAQPGEPLRFPVANYLHIGGANHFDLLNHPAVGDQLVRWLRGPPGLPAPQRP